MKKMLFPVLLNALVLQIGQIENVFPLSHQQVQIS
jgi:hypothetical protein